MIILAIAIVSGTAPLYLTESLGSSNLTSTPRKRPPTALPGDSEDRSDTDSFSEPEILEQVDRLHESLLEVTHIITCLYKFSIAIRNPAPRDKLEKCPLIDMSHYERFDIAHVSSEFPDAKKSLQERFGRANTQRRQFLKYYEMQHKEDEACHHPQPIQSSAKRTSSFSDGPAPIGLDDQLTTIKASTLGVTPIDTAVTSANDPGKCPEVHNSHSDASHSVTPFIHSEDSRFGSPLSVRVPPPPNQETAYKIPFQCPYCYSIISVSQEIQWM